MWIERTHNRHMHHAVQGEIGNILPLAPQQAVVLESFYGFTD